MHAVVQDLEALKELNDELEENHIENEKQLQEELGKAARIQRLYPSFLIVFSIDSKENRLQEYKKRLDGTESDIVDYEGVITQFRDLVLNLQGDLEQLREEHHVQQTESQTMNSQSKAMLNLNMKLQTSVLRNQSKTVDLELRKMEAAQAKQHLSIIIVRYYLDKPRSLVAAYFRYLNIITAISSAGFLQRR